MIKRSILFRLQDIIETLDGAKTILEGVSFQEYVENFAVRMVSERCVEIVSEATRHIPDDLKAQYPDTYWDEIKAIGNLLRHEYQRVDDLIMWRIMTQYFPELRDVVGSMLKELDRNQT